MRHCKVDTELSILTRARRRRRCDTARRAQSFPYSYAPVGCERCNAARRAQSLSDSYVPVDGKGAILRGEHRAYQTHMCPLAAQVRHCEADTELPDSHVPVGGAGATLRGGHGATRRTCARRRRRCDTATQMTICPCAIAGAIWHQHMRNCRSLRKGGRN